MKKLKVYIASPYTHGSAAINVGRQIKAKHILMDYGFVPFAPLESHFGEIMRARTEHEWLQWELEWLDVCDILVRIRPVDKDGIEIVSTGSDGESDRAAELKIPSFSFRNLEELEEWAKEVNKENLWDICIANKYILKNE
jgi:nucleoside 2-deoxyribosyltransferase